MKEHPILFNGEMVRAILTGRKTMTRRLKFNGVPGDRIWVRETLIHGSRNNPEPRYNHLWRYAADNKLVMVTENNKGLMIAWAHHTEKDVCPSIHMPRWAARIILEVISVRKEWLRDITEEDAIKEGVAFTKYTNANARYHFMEAWNSINGKKHPWSSNPEVKVIEFKQVTP